MFDNLDKYDIVLMVGNYGSGKSGLAKNNFKERKRIDRHQIRHHLKEMTEHGERWKPEDWNEDLEGLIKHIEHDIICHFLDRNDKIIIDNTSLTVKSRKRYIECAKKYNKTIACVFLNRDSKELLQQNRIRKYPVPDHIIVQLVAKTEFPSEEEGFGAVVYA